MASASGSPIGRTNQVHPELVTPGTPSSTGQDRLNRQPAPPDGWRKAIYQTFEDPSYNTAAKFISVGMMVIIVVSTLAFIFESELLIGGSLYDTREDAKASIRPRRGQRACRAVPPPPSRRPRHRLSARSLLPRRHTTSRCHLPLRCPRPRPQGRCRLHSHRAAALAPS